MYGMHHEGPMSDSPQHGWLEGIVGRNDRDLKRYLSQRVGNRAEVEDLTQEIYLRLLRIERKDLIRSPEAFLFRLASNATYEWHLRARNRLPHSAAELDLLESSEDEPLNEVWHAQLARELTAALAGLSPKCRATVVLHRRDQMTYAQIGVQLGISVSMVKKYLAHGLALCRTQLRERLGLSERKGGE